jgi:hypothetical protein
MSSPLVVKRYPEASMPLLAVGEIGFCTDTFKVFLGTGIENKYVGSSSGPWPIDIVGEAGTAVKLSVPVTINGVPFDGSENITVTIGGAEHDFMGGSHVASGLIAGRFLKATGSDSFDFVAHGLNYASVGAEQAGTFALHLATFDHEHIENGETAFNWGDHGTVGYSLDTHNHDADYEPIGEANTEAAAHITAHESAFDHDAIPNGQTAYGWGDHASAGYSVSTHNHTGTYDPYGEGHTQAAAHIVLHEADYAHAYIANGQTAFGWGNHASAGYSGGSHNHTGTYDPAGTGNTEATAHVGAHETTYSHANYNTAYGWGNHASAGYAASGHNHSGVYSVVSHDHSGVYAATSHNHSSISGSSTSCTGNSATATTATTASYATYLWSTSHSGSYYISNAWTGTYWHLTSNHGSPVSCGYSTNSGTAAACSGNAATSSACSGNAATATTATNLSGGTVAATSITATGDITAFYSDDRLKINLGNIWNALNKVKILNGFHYRANEIAQALGYESIPDVGVSAQQVQSVLPEAVVPAPIDSKYLTVKYERLIPLLIEAIKELSSKVEVLEAR